MESVEQAADAEGRDQTRRSTSSALGGERRQARIVHDDGVAMFAITQRERGRPRAARALVMHRRGVRMPLVEIANDCNATRTCVVEDEAHESQRITKSTDDRVADDGSRHVRA